MNGETVTRRNIPFVKFGSLKFLDAAHVEDVLALLHFVDNPRERGHTKKPQGRECHVHFLLCVPKIRFGVDAASGRRKVAS
jgi:superfamily I DNA/RNA helicase